jgi:ketosteroid isomerase-like protein
MSRTQSDSTLIRETHLDFYRALASGDIRRVAEFWARDVPVSCQHADWPNIRGRRFVLESWSDRLNLTQTDEIRTSDLTVILTGRRALVIAVDDWDRQRAATTTLYRLEGAAWRITHHQAMAIRTYVPK